MHIEEKQQTAQRDCLLICGRHFEMHGQDREVVTRVWCWCDDCGLANRKETWTLIFLSHYIEALKYHSGKEYHRLLVSVFPQQHLSSSAAGDVTQNHVCANAVNGCWLWWWANVVVHKNSIEQLSEQNCCGATFLDCIKHESGRERSSRIFKRIYK